MTTTDSEAIQPPGAASLSTPSRRSQWIVFLAVFALSWFWLSRDIGLPFHIQNDEAGKARQVVERKYNHHHPMLMIISAERAYKLTREAADLDHTYQNATIVGRAVVSMWISLGIAAAATLGWRWAGWTGVLAVVLIEAGDATTYRIAHIFKEDGVVVGTFGLVLLAFDVTLARIRAGALRPEIRRAVVWLGIALGLCCASKYIAVLALPLSLGFLAAFAPPGQRLRLALICLGCALLAFALGNYRTLLDPAAAWQGVGHEFESLAHGSKGVRRAGQTLPNWSGLRRLEGHLEAALWWVVIPLPLIALWRPARLRPGTIWLAWSFALVMMIAVSLTFKYSTRYITAPSWVVFILLALLIGGLARSALSTGHSHVARLASAVTVLAMAFLLGNSQWNWTGSDRTTVADYRQVFARYNRRPIEEAVAALPDDAVVMVIARPMLPTENEFMFKDVPRPWPQTVLRHRRVERDGTLATLRGYGTTHVLFPYQWADRFQNRVEGSTRALEKREVQEQFWTNLMEQSVPISSSPPVPDPLRLDEGWELRELTSPNTRPQARQPDLKSSAGTSRPRPAAPQ